MEQLLFTGSAPPRHCASWPARLSDEHGPNAHMLREPCCRLGPAAGRAGPPFFPVLGTPSRSRFLKRRRRRRRCVVAAALPRPAHHGSRHNPHVSTPTGTTPRSQTRSTRCEQAGSSSGPPTAGTATWPLTVETGRRCYTVATGSTESYPLRLATPAARADQQRSTASQPAGMINGGPGSGRWRDVLAPHRGRTPEQPAGDTGHMGQLDELATDA